MVDLPAPVSPMIPQLPPVIGVGQAIAETTDIQFTGNVTYELVDDDLGKTLCAASSLDKDVQGKSKRGSTVAAATEVGGLIAGRAKEKGIALYCRATAGGEGETVVRRSPPTRAGGAVGVASEKGLVQLSTRSGELDALRELLARRDRRVEVDVADALGDRGRHVARA